METQRYNKQFLLAKHIQIQPDKEQMSLINQLVTLVERSLKHVSDKMMRDELTVAGMAPDSADAETMQRARKLRGVFRVGALEKGLLLKTDRELGMIALTAEAPSLALVRRILDELEACDLVRKASSEDAAEPHQLSAANFKVTRDDSLLKTEGCAYVVYEYKRPEVDFYRVKIGFTSTQQVCFFITQLAKLIF